MKVTRLIGCNVKSTLEEGCKGLRIATSMTKEGLLWLDEYNDKGQRTTTLMALGRSTEDVVMKHM